MVALLVLSSPVTAHAAASAQSSVDVDFDDESELCLPSPSLTDMTMDVYKQEADNLQTRDATVESANNGPPETENTFRIETGLISADTLCMGPAEDTGEVEDDTAMQIELHDVYFEDTELTGAWTDIEFGQGEADSMTVVLPLESAISVLIQTPVSIDIVHTIQDLLGLEDGLDDELDGMTEEEIAEADEDTDLESPDEDESDEDESDDGSDGSSGWLDDGPVVDDENESDDDESSGAGWAANEAAEELPGDADDSDDGLLDDDANESDDDDGSSGDDGWLDGATDAVTEPFENATGWINP